MSVHNIHVPGKYPHKNINRQPVWRYAMIYNIAFLYLLIIQFCKTAKDSQWFRNGKHPKNEHNY